MTPVEIITVVISIASIVIAVGSTILSWKKGRAIYGIETEVVRQPTGTRDDAITNTTLNKKLSSGKYTILSTMERSKSDNDWELLLGKIKKDKKDGTK